MVGVGYVEFSVLDGGAEGVVEFESVASGADPFGGVYGAVGIDERYVSVVLGLVFSVAGVDDEDEVALWVEDAALCEMKAAVDFDVVGDGYPFAGFVGSAEGLAGLEGFGTGKWGD